MRVNVMTMAAAMDQRTPPRTAGGVSRIASVDIFTSMQDAEPIWRELESTDVLATPYQRFDFQAAWQRHIGQHEGLEPFIVVACDSTRQPLMLLPLGIRQDNGVRTAQYFGGKHTTFNMALWRHDFAASATQKDLDALVRGIRAHPEKVDVLALTQQPRRWLGLANPMALLPSHASINDCPLLPMTPGQSPTEHIDHQTRRMMKAKEKKLLVLPGYRYCLGTTDDEITRMLDAFFILKPLRMAAQKLPNVFAEPGVEAFIREACLKPLPDGGRAMEIHALLCNDEVIAVSAGVADGQRLSVMFGTYTMSNNAKYSPGLILLREIIDRCAARGFTSFDLGIGTDDYKRQFCKSDEPIFDSAVPLTTLGCIAATGMSSMTNIKRLVKQTPALMQIAQLLRGALHR